MKYNISSDSLLKMLYDQGETCAICPRAITLTAGRDGRASKSVAQVDHDHYTGKVRGLLCKDCNLGIGRLCDSPKLLTIAIEYLKATA